MAAGSLFTSPLVQWSLDDGSPNAAGSLKFFTAGTTTPQLVYSQSDLDSGSSLGSTVTLDDHGRTPTGVYFLPTGYKVQLLDVNAVELGIQDDVEDVGQVFAAEFGLILSGGSKSVTSGYIVLPTDFLITVNSTGGANPCIINLPAAASRTEPLTVLNAGTIPLAITPNGTDTVNTLNAAFAVPAAASPIFPSVTFVSDGVSAWYVTGANGL